MVGRSKDRRWFLGCLALGLALAPGRSVAAGIPATAPRYDLCIQLDVDHHRAVVRQRVTWINMHETAAHELVFNVHSRFKLPGDDIGATAKMMELLRMMPHEALETEGHACEVHEVTLAGASGAVPGPALTFRWKDPKPSPAPQPPRDPESAGDTQTALEVPLPRPVARGETVTIELLFTMRLPQKMGRWGQWQGVTFLSNWLPVLAVHDDQGWHPTPFIPWHQPFFNEAGAFTAQVTLPCRQAFACTGSVLAVADLGDGRKRVDIGVACARDFAFLCSERYQELTTQAGPVTVRCVAFPEHEYHARTMLRVASEAILTYSRWFGPYPYPEFTIVESYFGWNGNECAGLVMIDERVFGMPHLAEGYVEYLIAHETCHQWWYNVVGTNGYCETWMDEALATYFSHRLITGKCGTRHNKILTFPRGLEWLPNIDRDTYRNYGLYGTLGRGEATATVQEMEKFGHVVTLFSMCYDRGSKIVGLIEERLGETAFLDFMRLIYRKYYFRILRVEDFKHELQAYTGNAEAWDRFFADWLYGAGSTDWAVEKVTVEEVRPRPQPHQSWPVRRVDPLPCRVTVLLHQKAEINEDTVLGFRLDDSENYQIRVPVLPQAGRIDLDSPPGVMETLPGNRVRVEVMLPCRPTQIAVDPDQLLVDREPANNYWKPPIRWRFSPIYSMLDETDLTTAYDRWNIIFGPWLYGTAYDDPWYTRSMMAGLRVGAYRTQQFAGGAYVGYRTDYRDLAAGVDGLWDHWPWSHTQVGFNAERSLNSLDDSHFNDRGVVFGRYVFQYSSSLYLPPMQYVEGFGAFEKNQLPIPRYPEPGGERFDNMSLVGLHYHQDYLTPYWDPEGGFRLDATYAAGLPIFGEHRAFNRLSGQFSFVKGLPDWLGPLSETRIAARLYGAVGLPNDGLYFPLGGAGLFRGFDQAERQGSMVWVGSLEWRVPLVRGLRCDAFDHIAGLRSISAIPFYDVGNAYVSGHAVGEVAHAVGFGLAFDVAWFSFVERTTIRFDVAQTLNTAAPMQFNFYFQHPF